MDNVKNFFAERERAASGERRALDECITKYSQATNDIEQIALQSYSAKLCQLEADLHFDRENWKVDDDPITQRMTSYFQSSQYKNAFARLMGLSRYVKQPYTVHTLQSALSSVARLRINLSKTAWQRVG